MRVHSATAPPASRHRAPSGQAPGATTESRTGRKWRTTRSRTARSEGSVILRSAVLDPLAGVPEAKVRVDHTASPTPGLEARPGRRSAKLRSAFVARRQRGRAGFGQPAPHQEERWPTLDDRMVRGCRPREVEVRGVANYILGRVTPCCPWYLPPRSLYEVSHTSSLSKNSTWAQPSPA